MLVLIFFMIFLECICEYKGITNTPFNDSVPIFNHVNSYINRYPNPYWGNIKTPYPTNGWLTNLGYKEMPVCVYPYLVTPIDTGSETGAGGGGIIACYPKLVASKISYTSTRRNDILFYIKGLGDHYISDQSTLGVTTSWDTPGFVGPKLRVPWVTGHPYLTFFFNGTTFNLSTDYTINDINGSPPSGCINNRKFRIQLYDQATQSYQIWILWALNSEINLCYSPNGREDNNKALHPVLIGESSLSPSQVTVLRLAILISGDPVENVLQQYVNNIVVGGSVSIPENIGSDTSTAITFTWNAVDYAGNPLQTEDILMLGLPHHIDCIDRSNLKAYDIIPGAYNCIKGAMRGYVGSSWKLRESLTDIQWYSRYPINPLKIEMIIAQLKKDVNMLPVDTDTYGYGKFVASYARLILIAEQLGVSDLIPFMLNRLELFLGPWLYTVYYRDTFLYDTTWGGTISANGWLSNSSDYGNGIYNDHHFHNGYYIYAGAVILKYDKQWEWAPFLMHLVRDIANPSIADPYYPITRHKDWFAGHSWAQGLDVTYDGKNQESSSEAVNAYYAIVLYGIATNNDLIKNVGRVLLATEIRSVHKYWHTLPDSPYPPIFSDNSVVGIVWQAKLDYATFFSADAEHIHCIQMIPFTPISEDLLPVSWVTREYPILAPRLPFAIPEWQAYIILDLAIIDQESAWTLIEGLPAEAFGKGNSRTSAYWWVATRPRN